MADSPAPGGPESQAPGSSAVAPSASLFARRRFRVGFLIALALTLIALAYRLSDVLNPFLLAFLIAYILHPAVRFLSERARLPRGAAVAALYVLFAAASASVVAYSALRTSGEVGRIMTRAAGGWQRISRAPPSAIGATQTALPSSPTSDATIDALPHVSATGADGPDASPAPPVAGEPVYGDDMLRSLPGSPTIAFLDLDQDGKREPTEPLFERSDRVSWRPVKTDPASAEWRRVAGMLDRIKESLQRRYALIDPRLTDELIERAKANAATIAGAGASLWNWFTQQLFGGIVTAIGYLVLVPVYTFFLARGFGEILSRVDELLPGRHRARIRLIPQRVDRACAAFFRGRFLICAAKAVLIWLGLWSLGVEFSLTIGLIAGTLSVVPFVGAIVGAGLAAVFAYGPSYEWRLFEVAALFALVEVFESLANTVLLGREVGLHPVTLLLAFFVFGDLLGFMGVLLAVPLAAIAKILGEEIVLPELRMLASETRDTKVSGIWPKR